MGHTVCTEPQYLYKGSLYLYLLLSYLLYNTILRKTLQLLLNGGEDHFALHISGCSVTYAAHVFR